jgi:hypothetical protein
MTGFTVEGELGRSVRGIVCLVILLRMTSITGIRSLKIIALVAGITILCDETMGSLKNIIIIVNGKSGGLPIGDSRMAIFTAQRDIQCAVVRVYRGIIGNDMTV